MAWCVIIFLHSPYDVFWACLGDLPPDKSRGPESWVLLCNLMLQQRLQGLSHSPAIPGLDSTQSNDN